MSSGRAAASRAYSLPRGAEEILLGSFVIAEATVNYIKKRNPEVVSIVAMGWEGDYKAIEDELCAEYLESRLCGERPDFPEMAAESERTHRAPSSSTLHRRASGRATSTLL